MESKGGRIDLLYILCKTDEPQTSAPEINNILDVNNKKIN